MQRQHGLLLDGLDRHEAHVGPRHGFADGFRIGCVVLVRLDVGFDKLGGHQLDPVPEPLPFAGPVVSAAAGFHADQTRWQVSEESRNLLAPESFLQCSLAVLVDAVNLERVLR